MSPEYYMAAAIFAFFAAVAGGLYLAGRLLLSGSSLSDRAKRAVHLILAGPVVTIVAGLGVYQALLYLQTAAPGALPSFATPADVALLLEVAVLAVVVRVIGSVVKVMTGSVEQLREAGKIIVYSVYTIGLVALAYIILSSPISPGLAGNVWALLNFLTGLLVTYLAASTVNIVFKKYSEAIERRELRLETALAFVRRIVLAAIALIGVAISTFSSFPEAGAAITSLFIAAGFGSIVIGLAAQSSLANIFAGMVLAFSQPFKINDAVLFKNEWCWVEDMRLNFTILKTWDNRRLVVPNQMFLNDSLINYTLNDPSKLVVVYVQIAYEADLDAAIEALKDAARRHPDFLPVEGIPVVHVMEFNESGISLRLLSRAKDQPTAFQMSKDLLYSARKEFREKGIDIAYPRRELTLANGVADEIIQGRGARKSRSDGKTGPKDEE